MMNSEHISPASQLKRKKETDEKEGPRDHGIAPAWPSPLPLRTPSHCLPAAGKESNMTLGCSKKIIKGQKGEKVRHDCYWMT